MEWLFFCRREIQPPSLFVISERKCDQNCLQSFFKGDCPDPFGQEIVRIGTPTRVDRYYQHTRLEETASAINITDGENFPSKSFLPSSDVLLSNDLFNLGPSSSLMHEDMIA